MLSRILPLFAFGFVALAQASEPAAPDPLPVEPSRSGWTFSLLPKSLQRHPSLDFHVVTELTAEGRKRALPTAEHQVYYIASAGKFTQLGNNTPAGETPPDVGYLTRAMHGALAASHYTPASPSSPLPAIAIVFNYGSFARFSTAADDFQQTVAIEQMAQSAADTAARNGTGSGESSSGPFILADDDSRDASSLLRIVLRDPHARTDVLHRASLVAGDKFSQELAAAINREAISRQSRAPLLSGQNDPGSPFQQFMNANPEMMDLVEESFSSCYFVVASAFDYAAMKQGRKVLLWRTKMTVNSAGISMSESLPSLVTAAGPYLGREMTGVVTLTRKISRNGKVEVGTPRVIDYSAPRVP
ncbi:hypothetical protein [Opitutus sp. ER46]|uniref:hypothetical protein n=1 Tax=Opitutus sp. ER46 TaxID=2161864 RepID=UPI000D31C202|nr:hypothetical protein [Opitutus sp. ER46]PTX96532.1 hypothetical protein DB354_07700 [Opitutus sp. ER46]